MNNRFTASLQSIPRSGTTSLSVSGEEKRKKSGPRDSPVAVSRRCGSRASRGRRWKGWGAHSGREGLYPHSEQCREASILQLKWCRASWASARERERERETGVLGRTAAK
ncbi:hypothetical protein CEXT_571481 [Caerostris extrusa]|uniref:Uncharacterized protein n=1 Tax=Caerostris extrusa TaxID=172846 RepID=A0AAV4R3M3_CAEEX|nr:hypothetical protein CEXT_571481 [Caerostris extrusa]